MAEAEVSTTLSECLREFVLEVAVEPWSAEYTQNLLNQFVFEAKVKVKAEAAEVMHTKLPQTAKEAVEVAEAVTLLEY